MEVIALAGILGVGYFVTYPRPNKDTPNSEDASRPKGGVELDKYQQYKLFYDGGMTYGVGKPDQINLANLNEAYKPWTAPAIDGFPTVNKLYDQIATRTAYLQNYAYPFWFMQDQQMPIGNNHNKVYNVELPKGGTIWGDDHNTLRKLPRFYEDSLGYHIFSNSGFVGEGDSAGEPTESLHRREDPDPRSIGARFNPYGPGGELQTLFTRQTAERSRRLGTNRSVVMGPVQGRSPNIGRSCSSSQRF